MDLKLIATLMVLSLAICDFAQAELEGKKICLDMMESMLPRFCGNCCQNSGYSKEKSYIRPVDTGNAKFERTSECICVY